jgi:hypothetical protein
MATPGASDRVTVTAAIRPVAEQAFEGCPTGDPGRGQDAHDVGDGGLRRQQRIEQQPTMTPAAVPSNTGPVMGAGAPTRAGPSPR